MPRPRCQKPTWQRNRKLRTLAHREFDALWQSGQLSREDAYRELAETLRRTPSACHFGTFSASQLKTVRKWIAGREAARV